ncbi:MAG: MFS transporter [Firmicutes bacterium]|nr:MFS transporter [Bacillota bacterium]
MAHHQQAGHPPQGTTSSRDGALARERVPWRTRLIYGSGDLFGGGAYNIINFYYLIFLTDVAHVRPALAGIIVLASRIWDAVSDPLMGSITDRTRSRFGRRRPYFLAGSVLIFLAFALHWYAPAFASETARFAYALFSYIFFATVFTLVMVPYSALAAEITLDYHERTRLNSVRLAFSLGAGVAAALVPMPIVRAFPTPQEGYLPMGIIFGLLFAAPWPVIFLHIRERPELQTPLPSQAAAQPAFRRWTRFFLEPLQVRAFRLLVGMHLTAYLTIDVLSALFAYYATYSLGRPGMLNLLLGAVVISQILFLPVYTRLSRRLSKGGAWRVGALVTGAGTAALYLVPPEVPGWLLYGLAAWVGAGLSGACMLPWAIFPDVTDVGELAFGERREGSFSGLMTFFRKVASAVALFIVSISWIFRATWRPNRLGAPPSSSRRASFRPPGSSSASCPCFSWASGRWPRGASP